MAVGIADAAHRMAFDDQIAAHYEAWYEAPEGRRADALEKASLRRLLEGFAGARGHSMSESVLEVGSGTGHFTRWLAQQELTAVGLDLSVAMLARAQALDGIPLVRGDACRLPFADGTFDLVAFITTLEFLERPREVLAEALRVTRQGLILGVLNRSSVLGLRRRLAGLLRPSVYDAAHFYRVGELERLLRSVAGQEAIIEWHTTLLPRGWPRPRSAVPWGGFIGIALRVSEGQR
jgi:ubiquinone/menaquinone biosynthesis C-methylase UbiE